MKPFSSQAKDSRKLMEFIKRSIRNEMSASLMPEPSRTAVSILERVEQNGHGTEKSESALIYSTQPTQLIHKRIPPRPKMDGSTTETEV